MKKNLARGKGFCNAPFDRWKNNTQTGMKRTATDIKTLAIYFISIKDHFNFI